MPELPEVETIRRGLAAKLLNDFVISLEVRDPRLLPSIEVQRWKRDLPGQTWTHFNRRGKFLAVQLANGGQVVFHLRMTGQLVLSRTPSAGLFRLRLRFQSGWILDFCDQRRFGEVWLLAVGDPWPSKTVLGPDALTELTRDQFLQVIHLRSTRIHPLLLEQKTLAGVGNIYAQEALFKAGIRPSRAAARVTRREGALLFQMLRETLLTAIEHGGSSSRNYLDADGRAGRAQTLHAVYRKAGQPCPRCRIPLRGGRVGGRGTVFCARCQK